MAQYAFDYFANLVYPGAYDFELEDELKDDLAISFCKQFTERCKLLGEDCYFPPSEGAPHLVEIFDKMFYDSKYILVIFTQNLSVSKRKTFERFYERIVISLQQHSSPVKCFPVLIGECAVPRITRYQVPACFELKNWMTQRKEWKFLLNGMGLQVDEELLHEWSGKPRYTGPSKFITTKPPPPQTRSSPRSQQRQQVQRSDPRDLRPQQEDVDLRYCYDLSKGGLVIFLNYRFVGRPQPTYRTGSEVDVESFKKLFQDEWGYTFKHEEDRTLAQTKSYFEEASLKQRFSQKRFSCVVVLVSSHGELNDKGRYVFKTPEAQGHSEEYEVEEFTKHAREGLYKTVIERGCPIVFFFSTCHGENYLKRVPAPKLESDAAPGVPETADMFMGLAQTKGSCAGRNNAGTLYLRTLCLILSRNPKVDLCKVHTMVQSQVGEVDLVDPRQAGEEFVQQPKQENTLRKDLYLYLPLFIKPTALSSEIRPKEAVYDYISNVVYPGAYASPDKYLEKDDLALDFYTIFKFRSKQLKSNCYTPGSTERPNDNYKKFNEIHGSSKWTLVVFTENLPSNQERDLQNFYPKNVLESLKAAVKKSPDKFIVILIGNCTIPQFMGPVKQVGFNSKEWGTEIDQWRTLFNAMQINSNSDVEVGWQDENIIYQQAENQQYQTRTAEISRYDLSATANRGAVIFLNYKFIEPPLARHRRRGSEFDVIKFKELFQKEWKYHFDDQEGLCRSEIKEYFKPENLKSRFGEKVEFSCLVVIVSGHGTLSEDKKYVLQVPNKDREKIEEYSVEEFIDDAKDGLHNALIKKGFPKVFLFSTCRGPHKLESDSVSTSAPTTLEQYPTNPLPIPKTSDTFIGYAQTKGSLSYRAPESGTLYLNSLHNTLRSTKEDICTVHTIAQRQVCQDAGQENLQQPAFYSTLRRQLFLAPL